MNKINKVLVILLVISTGFIQNTALVVFADEITTSAPTEGISGVSVVDTTPLTQPITNTTPTTPTEETSESDTGDIVMPNIDINALNLLPNTSTNNESINTTIPSQANTGGTTQATTIVRVITHVINDGPGTPGTAVAINFQNRVIQDNVNESTLPGYETGVNYIIPTVAPYYIKALIPGENDPHTPSIPTGYTATMSGDCGTSTNPITLASGDLKTCTVTYNDNGSVSSTEAYVKVYTSVINDGPGIVVRQPLQISSTELQAKTIRKSMRLTVLQQDIHIF